MDELLIHIVCSGYDKCVDSNGKNGILRQVRTVMTQDQPAG